jgi:ribosomal protein L18
MLLAVGKLVAEKALKAGIEVVTSIEEVIYITVVLNH